MMNQKSTLMVTLFFVALALGSAMTQETQPAGLTALPENSFVVLAGKQTLKPAWIDPVSAPDAGTLVGVLPGGHGKPGQTLHFDFTSATWVDVNIAVPTAPCFATDRRKAPGVYDAKRKRVIFGGQWAYDPISKTWEDLKVTTELYGKSYPGAPDVHNANMVYDPIHDEILLFPCQGMLNWDEWGDTGRLQGHLGTLVFSFKDRVWRRMEPGSEAMRQARQSVYDLYVRQWKLTETLAVVRRQSYAAGLDKVKPGIVNLAEAQRALANDTRILADRLAGTKGSDAYESGQFVSAAKALGDATKNMTLAAGELAAGAFAASINNGDLFRMLETVRQENLAVEPTARAESPMVYDPQRKFIVMFGGYLGNRSANDTWIYECEKRRWVRRSTEPAPPPRFNHFMYRHPPSGLIVMGGGKWAIPGGGGAGTSFRSLRDIWTYDVAADRWQRVEGTAPEIAIGYMYGLNPSGAAYSEKHDLLIYTGSQPESQGFRFRPGQNLPPNSLKEALYANRNDRFPYEQLPEVRQEIPLDKSDALPLMAAMPVNIWTQLPVEGAAQGRGWCIMSRDATRGYVVYFGGGHSTHMGDEIDIFQPGALAWIPSHRAYNTQIAPSGGWSNFLPQFNGGAAVEHTRAQYAAMDGVFLQNEAWTIGRFFYGPDSALDYIEKTHTWRDADYLAGKIFFMFRCDLEGSRTWTASPVPTEVRSLQPVMAFPALGRFGTVRHESRKTPLWTWVSVDREGTGHQVTPIPMPWPEVEIKEGQHIGALEERKQVMLIGMGKQSKVVETWIYDIAGNQWNRLEPKRSIPAPLDSCRAIVYCHDQEVVLASVTIKDDKNASGHWVYSFEHNTWAPFKAVQAEGLKVQDHGGPCWSQLVYAPQHKVFVWGAGPAMLRPDFSRVRWNAD